MILIVDDKSENIFALKKVLELNHFEVDSALSGEEALKKVLRKNYALIILDVQMPIMDGFEVAEAISGYKKAQNTAIIFLSAVSTHKKFITKGYASGAIDYITKPVDPDILMLKVKTFYRLYEQTKELKEAQVSLRKEIEVRKETENTLSKTAKELHSILESIPQIAFTAKTDGTIEYVNEHWYEYATDKNQFPQTYANNINLSEKWLETVQSGKQLELEVQIKKLRPEEEYRYHLLRATPVKTDENIVKWVGTFTDINHQKLINDILEKKVDERTKELQETNNELEASNNDLQQFASVASHDLKEPLRKVQVYSNIIKEKLQQGDNSIADYLDKVISSSTRMNGLINDLLNYSRLSQAYFYKVSDLNEILHDILIDLELMISDKKATVHVSDLPHAEVIPGLIRQLFQNLVSNALKFSRKDVPPVITIQSEVVDAEKVAEFIEGAGEFCIIKVSDNGIGFDEKYTDKIFTLFQRLNSRDKYEGTGIGLAIAKKIIDKHHGYITANSKENQGATFTIILPIKQGNVSN